MELILNLLGLFANFIFYVLVVFGPIILLISAALLLLAKERIKALITTAFLVVYVTLSISLCDFSNIKDLGVVIPFTESTINDK